MTERKLDQSRSAEISVQCVPTVSEVNIHCATVSFRGVEQTDYGELAQLVYFHFNYDPFQKSRK
jgi:hypothetical protein